jgi:hypothetical protein
MAVDQQNEYAHNVASVGYIKTQASESSGATRLVQFGENGDTGCFPGQSIALDELEPGEKWPRALISVPAENPWWPFASKHDWALASWFSRARCSKGSIEEYFKEPAFAPILQSQDGSMRNYNDLMKALYAIPYGIPNGDLWQEAEVTVQGQVSGAKAQHHTLIFRPIQLCLEFLLGHQPFASDLVWAPVKKYYGLSDSRVYDEMHTANWWWERQAELPPGATVVPVIISTDKTMMTQLRGDQTAWPVYMTIGNLTRSVRRKQSVPSTLLVGFLPISKEVSKASDNDMAYEVKSDLYHLSMGVIFKRMSSILPRRFKANTIHSS